MNELSFTCLIYKYREGTIKRWSLHIGLNSVSEISRDLSLVRFAGALPPVEISEAKILRLRPFYNLSAIIAFRKLELKKLNQRLVGMKKAYKINRCAKQIACF